MTSGGERTQKHEHHYACIRRKRINPVHNIMFLIPQMPLVSET